MARIPRYKIKRRATSILTVALGLSVAALAVLFFVSALRPDDGGRVTRKEVVNYTPCDDDGCGIPHTCLQIAYVTDAGEGKLACLTRAAYDKIQVGDRYER
ncbi:MAG: hypothetical protein HOV79_29655 [Hamadaea sp.]|nr:hypothetical protein [Hamadaea sp.]